MKYLVDAIKEMKKLYSFALNFRLRLLFINIISHTNIEDVGDLGTCIRSQ